MNKNRNWKADYQWFFELVNSKDSKIDSLSNAAYHNWYLSLFYLAGGRDRIDDVMRREGLGSIKFLIRTAYHEAGHAVCLWMNRMCIDEVGVIIDATGSRGICSIGTAVDFRLYESNKKTYDAIEMAIRPPMCSSEVDYSGNIDVCQSGDAATDRLAELYSEKKHGMCRKLEMVWVLRTGDRGL